MNKKEALAIVFSAADKYYENLAGACLLFICADKHLNTYGFEAGFGAGNFLHLTGLRLNGNISAAHFFRLCRDRRLREADISFSSDGTTVQKLSVLSQVVRRDMSAKMIGDYDAPQPKLYTERLAGGEKACVGFVRNNGDGEYVPNTLLAADIRGIVKRSDRIILTFRKKRGDDTYTEIVYRAKNFDFESVTLPDDYGVLPFYE